MYNDGETGVNAKNGIFQVTSASRRAEFETSLRHMLPQSVYSVNVRGSFKLSTGGGTVLPPGAVMPQVTLLCMTY